MKKIFLGVGIAIIALVGSVTYVVARYAPSDVKTAQTAPQTVTQTPKPPTVNELLKLVNLERKKVGVAPLVINAKMTESAQRKVEQLNNDGWGKTPHVDKNGVHGYTYAHEADPRCVKIGENLLTDAYTAKEGVYWWVASKPHYEAMINPAFDSTGFAIKNGYIVEHFCNLP